MIKQTISSILGANLISHYNTLGLPVFTKISRAYLRTSTTLFTSEVGGIDQPKSWVIKKETKLTSEITDYEEIKKIKNTLADKAFYSSPEEDSQSNICTIDTSPTERARWIKQLIKTETFIISCKTIHMKHIEKYFVYQEFYDFMNREIEGNQQYSFLFRVSGVGLDSPEKEPVIKMLGHQIGVKLQAQTYELKTERDNLIKSVYNLIVARLHYYIELYYIEFIRYLQVLYIKNDSYSEHQIVKPPKIEDLDLNRARLKNSQITLRSDILVFTTDINKFGIEFKPERVGGEIKGISENKDIFDVIYKQINKQCINLQDYNPSSTRFFRKVSKNIPFIITVTQPISKEMIPFQRLVNIFTQDGLLVVGEIKESADIGGLNGVGIWVREVGGLSIKYNNSRIVEIHKVQELPILKTPKEKQYRVSSNPFIGAFDIETFRDEDSLSKVYALGYTTINMAKEKVTKTFYLGEDGDSSDELVLTCIDSMLTHKNYIFYVHNLGGYDGLFILNTMLRYNRIKEKEVYKIKTTYKDLKVLRLVISKEIQGEKLREGKKIKPKKYTITLQDSYALLPMSLAVLSKSFEVSVTKGIFPYEFVSRDTLNYVGNTPDISYFPKRELISNQTYNQMVKPNWSTREETLKYLDRDLLSTALVMKKFSKEVFIAYNIQITECLTASRLALSIYNKHYLKDNTIPLIKNKNLYNDIKQGYYGGMTEVYRPYGKNLYYYDVNSLYPYAALQEYPTNKYTYICYNRDVYWPYNNMSYYGFFYCEIKTLKDNYLGYLPKRSDYLIFPNGVWKGWYFSAELDYAVRKGYRIKILSGYLFEKTGSYFSGYVTDLYKKKAESSGVQRSLTKLLLNSLLGRYGLNITKPKTEIVSKEKCIKMLAIHKVTGIRPLDEGDKILISYFPDISEEVCEEHNLDYLKILKHEGKAVINDDIEGFDNTSIVVAAAVTSYARVYMNQIKDEILLRGGKLYYMDTDSIVTDRPLKPELIGNWLGQFKLEYKIKEGYFISPKTYCLILEDGSIKIKSKGVFSDSLSLDDFKRLYNNELVQAMKSYSSKDYTQGSVTIGIKQINLNPASYTKRIKIYNEDEKWIDTKAVCYVDEEYHSNRKDFILVKYYLNSCSYLYNKIYSSLSNFNRIKLIPMRLIYYLPAPFEVVIPIIPTLEVDDYEINMTGSLFILYCRSEIDYLDIQPPKEEEDTDINITGSLQICSNLILLV